MKGYKVFNSDWTCYGGFQYEIGKTYEIAEEPILCKRGFHFCRNLSDCFRYYKFDPENKVAEVEASGAMVTKNGRKYVANKITIVRELSWQEVLELVNTGKDCTGFGNTNNNNTGNYNTGCSNGGDCNTGSWNAGNYNTGSNNDGSFNTGVCNDGSYNTGNNNAGHHNAGNNNDGFRNTGSWNKGSDNTGDHNDGDCNTGDHNDGDRNAGHNNVGSWNLGHHNRGCYNTGNYNVGNTNAGHRNAGFNNTGHYNTGSRNTGDYNVGNRNTGRGNTGCHNTGNFNSGNLNTGDWNATSSSSGCFCVKEPKILMFDKPSSWTLEDWRNSDAYKILFDAPQGQGTEWIDSEKMNETEKAMNPEYEITGGYLKDVTKTGNRQAWWDALKAEDKEKVMNIPNFDAEIFKQCTGIDVKTGTERKDTNNENN